MDTSLINFRGNCLESTISLLWRQWCSLGVSGHATPAAMNRLIDPEALILATSSIGRYEPRLFDEAMDWLAKYGSLINLQRLKNLSEITKLGNANVVCAMASWLAVRGKQPRWKVLANRPSDIVSPIQETLFLGIDGPKAKESDDLFLAHGLERSPFQPRKMSRAPRPTLAPNLVLSLRALIGNSARVEIILFLAGGAAAHAAEIARATGYAPRTLQALLQEMLLSGHLLSQEPIGQSKAKVRRGSNRRYHLKATDWAFLIAGQSFPQWTPWAAVFAFMQQVITSIPQPNSKQKHPSIISSKLREALAEHGQALTAAGLLPSLNIRAELSGIELLQTLSERLPMMIDQL